MRLFDGKEDGKMALVDEKTAKFALIAMVNGVVGNAIMFGLYNLAHASYWISSGANYAVVGVLSFVLNRKFTFKNTDSLAKTIPRYVLNIVLCYVIAYGIAKPVVLYLMQGVSVVWQENVAMFVGMWLYIVLNYFGQRYFAFRG